MFIFVGTQTHAGLSWFGPEGTASSDSTSFPLHLHLNIFVLLHSLFSVPPRACLLSSLSFLCLIPLWDWLGVYEKQSGGEEMRDVEEHIRE